ncbi:50S ribosomal protein L10 [Armatimonas rosea]|uniref:Large ribosomal subunit protein uL10 n=1 Tax=Armatimonas rosea TaxID=685828 RepID=A0A7W9W5D4_ARMRO|nr:50S ribosomal protein L10 [Armatimonas rosea]MBB6050329.1 large subunit ribosomal protein L10 [Armatimonas rosea]
MAQPKKKLGTKPGVVGEISDLLKSSSAVILTEYRGLSVPQVGDIRTKLNAADSESDFSVVKNTLFKRAADGIIAADADLDAALNGPTAVVFAKDSLAAAKVLSDYIASNRNTPLKIKGGVVDGVYWDAAKIDALAKIPPRDTLYAMILGAFQSPLTSLAATLASIAEQKAA